MLLASIVVALLLLPLWLDPFTLREVRNVTPAPGTPAPSSVARPATAAASAAPPAAGIIFTRDTFSRIVENGWGTADQGGGYSSNAVEFADQEVDGNVGLIKVGTDGSGWMRGELPHRDVDVVATMSASAIAGTVSAGPAVRVTDDGLYRARVISSETGVWLVIEHISSIDAEEDIVLAGPVALPAVTFAGGGKVQVRTQAEGSDPTTISAKAWMLGAPEPPDWQITAVDWTGALQQEGQVGVAWQVQNVPQGGVDIAFDDLTGTTTDGEGHR